jgi:branched-chain amino acid transport system ATP-binding protein
MSEILRVEDLHASYGKMEIIHGASIAVEENSISALIGPNGAGKSTMLKVISGLLKIKSGRVWFKNREITNLAPHEIINHGISLIPEDRKLFSLMTVQENLMLGAYNKRAWPNRRERIQWVYSHFPRLNERKKQLARTLSGGEQRMLAVGRGLMSDPKLLILDEPSLGLAPNITLELFGIIEKIGSENVTVLLVEQNVARTLQISSRAYVIENGQIVMEGGKELLTTPHIKEAYLRV